MVIMSVKLKKEKCISCFGCVGVCPVLALEIHGKFPECDKGKCTNCKACVMFCPVGALSLG
jgi:Fe-S-cluster-containing hydrogenase component 2